jgi:hypothetical protein
MDQEPMRRGDVRWYTGEWVMMDVMSWEAIVRRAAAKVVDSWGDEDWGAQGREEDSDAQESPHEGGESSESEGGERIGSERPRAMCKDSEWAPWDDKVVRVIL